MKISQKGFIAPLLLALIAILLIGGGAYVYVQNKQSNQPVVVSQTSQATSTVVTSSVTIDSVNVYTGPDTPPGEWVVELRGKGFSKSSIISLKRDGEASTTVSAYPGSPDLDGTRIDFPTPTNFGPLNLNAIGKGDTTSNKNAASIYSVQILNGTSTSNIIPIPNPYAGRG